MARKQIAGQYADRNDKVYDSNLGRIVTEIRE